MTVASSEIPKSFWWVVGVALLWNLVGLNAYVSQVTLSQEALAAMPDAERMLYDSVPSWATGAFAMAVTAGVLGCLLLAARKALALPVLVVSLASVLVQNFHSFFLMDAMSVVGVGGAVASGAIIVIGVYLVWFASDAKKKGWIN